MVDKKNPNRSALKGAGQYLFPPKQVKQEDLSQFLGKDPLVLDRLLAAPTQNKILSIIPSETYHIEDGVELTAKERMEAEQMQRDEQLRRRNPKAHNAMILGRKEKEYRPFQQAPFPQTSAHNLSSADIDPSMASTQPVYIHGPMTATGDMLPPPSTAPNVAIGNGSMGWVSSVADPIQPAITNNHLPRIQSLPDSNSTKEVNDTPVASERTGSRGTGSWVNGHNAEVNEDMSHNKENKGGRKHRLAADEERVSKKAKRAPVVSSEGTTKMFDDLISREAARSSERGV